MSNQGEVEMTFLNPQSLVFTVARYFVGIKTRIRMRIRLCPWGGKTYKPAAICRVSHIIGAVELSEIGFGVTVWLLIYFSNASQLALSPTVAT